MRPPARPEAGALVGAWLCAAALSCGGGLAQVEKRVADLQGRVDEVSGVGRATQSRLAALENRILLLQDEVETLRMAVRRGGPPRSSGASAVAPAPPDLPTVRLEPPEARETSAERPGPARPTPAAAVMDEAVYQDIDDEGNVVTPSGGRKTAATASPRPPASAPAPGRTPRRDPDGETALREYQSAYEMYQQGRVVEARAAFAAFAARYPKHPYADNAQYWVGECLYDQKDYEAARREFLRVMTEHPDGNKVPDAMVKVGLCDRALGRHEDALRMFRTVMLTYPDTDAAAVAMRLAGESP